MQVFTEEMTVVNPNEVPVEVTPIKPAIQAPSEFSGKAGDLQKDLALLAAEQAAKRDRNIVADSLLQQHLLFSCSNPVPRKRRNRLLSDLHQVHQRSPTRSPSR